MADQPYWNPSDKDPDVVLASSDRAASVTGSGITGAVRSTVALSSGKWYVEFDLLPSGGANAGGGVGTSSMTLASRPGADANGWAIIGTGSLRHNNVTTAYGDNINAPCRMAIDIDAGNIWFGEAGGVWFNSGNPATGANPAYTGLPGGLYLVFGAEASAGTKSSTLKLLADYSEATPSGFTKGWGGSLGLGDAALTEDADSVSGASTLLLQATASITQDDDSVSAVIGLTPAFADASITEADDSVSSAGVLPITGSASITGDDDSLTGVGALFILATGSALEDDDSVASAAALLIQGGAAIDDGADLISAEGALLIVGAANIVEDDDSVVANDFVPRGRADLYEEDDFLRFHGGISAEWMQEQATKGDIPNWNHCARCHKEMRPNQLLAERRRVGSTVIWTGLRVCSDCLDPIHPQDRQPRVMGGDPRPVPNARPFRGS